MYKSKQHRLIKNYLENDFEVEEKKENNQIKRRVKSAIQSLYDSKHLDFQAFAAAKKYQKAHNKQAVNVYPTINYEKIPSSSKVSKEEIFLEGRNLREEIEEISMIIYQYQMESGNQHDYKKLLQLAFVEERSISHCAKALKVDRNYTIKFLIKDICNILKEYY
jgi:hypothetical protein